MERNLSYSKGDDGVGGDHVGVRGDLISPSWLKLTYRVSRTGVMSSMLKISVVDIWSCNRMEGRIRCRRHEWMKSYSGPYDCGSQRWQNSMFTVLLVWLHCLAENKGDGFG